MALKLVADDATRANDRAHFRRVMADWLGRLWRPSNMGHGEKTVALAFYRLSEDSGDGANEPTGTGAPTLHELARESGLGLVTTRKHFDSLIAMGELMGAGWSPPHDGAGVDPVPRYTLRIAAALRQ